MQPTSVLSYCTLKGDIHSYQEKQLFPQPLEATAEAPAKFGRIVPYEHIPAVANDIEAKGLLAMGHGNTGYRHN